MFAVPQHTVAPPAAQNVLHPAVIARALAADPGRWLPLLRLHGAQRFTTRLERTPAHETWLMTWLPGQGTDLHNHGGATGAFTVVAGTLTELVARAHGTGRPHRTVHEVPAGISRVFGPGYVHQVSNAGARPAVSIHVYRPARLPMINYRLLPGAELRREIPVTRPARANAR